MKLRRLLRHLWHSPRALRRTFPPSALRAIEEAVREVESRFSGQLRVVIEGALDLHHLWRNVSPRNRALELFSSLRMWDTEHNNGVLFYVLVSDRSIELVADRGISGRVAPEEWERICNLVAKEYARGNFAEGTLAGIRALGNLLALYFPRGERVSPNELEDRPVVLEKGVLLEEKKNPEP
ncbi:TPM domain-containing protein [Candidatus Methylacidithermus pantelleriae]|uniref:TPM_phosphatase domain-containing protein n=1 Tax=Candidatus Methylacidithermus pantelleriae TaxID=2744239 RepID=A0A8J2BLW0_9BACT|nr:TPM domain-containing protein [Candidatus Methylacidithermus pantelleriae]CAF0688827.1 TPM_phosphatase domain-containing protein [Candidatus Methylacidithermus pantelleriae]